MIRWLMKKVVKYALEELRDSPEFQSLVAGSSRPSETASAAEKEAEPDSNESQRAIAELMASQGADAKLSDIGSTEKVRGDRGAQQAVVDQLKNIGD
jgi:hypothetical protein